MSVLFEDLSHYNNTSPTKSIYSDKHNTLFRITGAKTKPIRADSPTTIQACNELGLLLDDLKQKTIEDFKDNTVGEEVIQIRFNHYMKRYEQVIKDVTAVKKKIARRNRIEQQQPIQSPKSPSNLLTGSVSSPGFVDSILNPPKSAVGFRQSSLSPLTSSMIHKNSSSIHANFNKTVYYFRNSHKSAETKDIEDIIGSVDDAYGLQSESNLGVFYKTFTEEVSKFNRIKKYKQREAKSLYEDEIRRIKVLETMEEKHKRHAEKELKLAALRKEKEEERRKIREAKAQKIKDMERKFREQKENEKEKMREKFEEIQHKLLEEGEDKRKQIAEREKKLENRLKEVAEKKKKLLEEEQRQCDIRKEALNSRISSRQEQRRTFMSQRTIRMKEMVDDIEGHKEKKKEIAIAQVEADLNKIVEKLTKKETNFQTFKEQHHSQLKERETESVEKTKKLERHQKIVDQKFREKVEEMNEKSKKIQENFELKKENEDKQRKLKGEINRLKLLDRLENHTRLERRTQFERLKVLDKEKNEQEKIAWLKSYREVAQRTKLEVAIQAKVEKDRIDDNVNDLKKLVYATNSSTKVTDNQKKLLKAVLLPTDFESIAEAEKRREAETKAKLGLTEDNSNSGLNTMSQSQMRKKFLNN